MRLIKLISGAAFLTSLSLISPFPCFGMGGVGVNIRVPGGLMGSPGSANRGMPNFAHGSPAATNPAVAMMEAKQRDAQVTAEIIQARKVGMNVSAAESYREQGEIAIQAGLASEAMLHFNDAELAVGSHNTTMGKYTRSTPVYLSPASAVVH